MTLNYLVYHNGHIIAACAHGHIRIIKSLYQSLPVRLRIHQQVPYNDLIWSLVQMLDDRIIFYLHSSAEFLRFSFA